ncbi:HvfC/BufC N-terminal domain-containing protein [Bradyrhizobium guangzhouense]|uniref:HvfC/BufC N-terminal domain-containing protein n=1 Tax=Bradyrhizobium guangzhouense TaxID=1325095 RepID=UPI001009D24E|nr:DNA-binding domain-containing protein [Bradyrhizobium guangzhouense]RXH15246.1 DUF2063 domain-containing protein [Bradyrhizobium guangzhouense]
MQPEPDASYAAAFAPALLDPVGEIPSIVTGPCGKSAVKCYNVHRNNVTVSLIDALGSIYPAVQRLTGADFFRAMARIHVRKTPPASPLLFDYGRDFPAFIEGYEHAQSLPWLADVARIERAWLDAYHAADSAPLLPSSLARVAPDRLAGLVFTVHPATRVVRSPYAAVSIFAANRGGSESAGTIDASVPEDALITRPDVEIVVQLLPPGGAVFLTCLMSGSMLAEAAAAALEDAPDFDLATNIAGLFEAGAFASLTSGDAR